MAIETLLDDGNMNPKYEDVLSENIAKGFTTKQSVLETSKTLINSRLDF